MTGGFCSQSHASVDILWSFRDVNSPFLFYLQTTTLPPPPRCVCMTWLRFRSSSHITRSRSSFLREGGLSLMMGWFARATSRYFPNGGRLVGTTSNDRVPVGRRRRLKNKVLGTCDGRWAHRWFFFFSGGCYDDHSQNSRPQTKEQNKHKTGFFNGDLFRLFTYSVHHVTL